MQNELRAFYQSFSGKGESALEPDDPHYVPLLEGNGNDPIKDLYQRIDLAVSESVHVLTGFRGNGKSTQLKRLKKMLEEQSGCAVFLVNMLDYMLMTKPVDISDFTLSLMAALSSSAEELTEKAWLAPIVKDIQERFVHFLTKTNIEFDELTLKSPAVDLGLKLKTDQTFKAQIQKHFEGRLTQITDEACNFVSALVDRIREQRGNPDLKVVLLVDSFEQLRSVGVGEDAMKVYDSVRELFSGQASNLSFPMLHIVYTVPPYLPIWAPNLGRTLGGNPVTQWPNIHVRYKTGEADENGLNIMKRIVEKRFPAWRDVIPEPFIYEFARCSGGDIRDFFRLLREAAISLMNVREKNSGAVLDKQIADRVIQQLKIEFMTIAKEDAAWLANIHESKEASLPKVTALPDLVRFFDTNRIMNYLNGEPWFDVHPLLVKEIEKIIKPISEEKD